MIFLESYSAVLVLKKIIFFIKTHTKEYSLLVVEEQNEDIKKTFIFYYNFSYTSIF